MFKVNKKLLLAIILSVVLGGFLLGLNVLAQGIDNEFVQATGLGGEDIRLVVARIINIFLGLLGVIAVALIIYGGFIWMTAGGNEEKIAQAKKFLLNAAIGLAIILSAYAIARFVVSRLGEATGLGEAEQAGAPGGIAGGEDLFRDSFVIRSFTPVGQASLRNIVVKILFNRDVSGESAVNNFEITVAESGEEVDGRISVDGKWLEFQPAAVCPEPNQDKKCFAANTEYKVEVLEGLISLDGKTIICGGLAKECSFSFISGDLVDVALPRVEVSSPERGESVSVNDFVPLQALAHDDVGVGRVDFLMDGEPVDEDAPAGALSKEFLAEGFWDTTGLDLLSRHTITARAVDLDDNSAVSQGVEVIVRAEHCFNEIQDAGETSEDCGGEIGSADYCGACPAESCADNFDCYSLCDQQSGVCLAPPKIRSLSPGDGAVGNYITILGDNFGADPGSIVFLGDPDSDDDDLTAPFAGCEGAWQNSLVVVEVPAGALSGPLKLTTAGEEALSDSTDDFYGPLLEDFIVNNVVRPGICALNPARGQAGSLFEIQGKQFGSEEQTVIFGAGELSDISKWQDSSIEARVPNLAAGSNSVAVAAGEERSNILNFNIISSVEEAAPRIDYLNPTSGSVGQYLTIAGDNFGRAAGGSVQFIKKDDPTFKVAADFDFPAMCSEKYWQNKFIIAKVPQGLREELGEYNAGVITAGGQESNLAEFEVNEEALTPGICAIEPTGGPVDMEVFFYGNALGDGTGQSKINFWPEATVDPDFTNWASAENLISTKVPAGAQSGPARVFDEAGAASNQVPFEVGACQSDDACGEGLSCCGDGSCRSQCPVDTSVAEYSWLFSTGEIPVVPQVLEQCDNSSAPPAYLPSPTPYGARSGGDQVCANAAIAAEFNTLINQSTLNSANILVEKCVGSVENSDGDPLNPCLESESVFSEGMTPQITITDLTDGQGNISRNGFQIAGDILEDNSYYRVSLTTAVQGEGTAGGQSGAFMEPFRQERAQQCGYTSEQANNISYCWTFGTADNICEIKSIKVNPDPLTITDKNDSHNYLATPLAAANSCLMLDASAYSWQWSSSREDKATVTNDGSEQQTVTPLKETVPGPPIDISATTEGKSGQGRLTIDFADPQVVDFWPNCQAACQGASVGAKFNIEMKNVNTNTIKFGECVDESCRDIILQNIGIDYQYDNTAIPITNEVIINPTAGLQSGVFYRVIIQGGSQGVKSTSGKSLTKLNYGQNYSWTFRVKEDSAACQLTRLEIAPRRSILTYIGQTQELNTQGFGPPDDCNPTGQRLALRDQDGNDIYDWQWSSSGAEIIDLIPQDSPWDGELLDANLQTNPYCTGSCLNSGTLAGVAVCGNNVTETGEDCDDGNTAPGDGCSEQCLNKGASSDYESTCGNGAVETGEDCDDGNTAPGDGCSEQCINEGSATGGVFCGNSVVEKGETCDDGNIAGGDGCSARCLNEGASSDYESTCGNGAVETGEDCDDGNTAPGDGCGNICLKEGSTAGACILLDEQTDCEADVYCEWDVLASACQYEKNYCAFLPQQDCEDSNACLWLAAPDEGGSCRKNICGDGQIDLGEVCDDGNVTGGDGCNSSCLAEGLAAGGGALCGNGVVGPGEDCDDGNTASGDGCSNRCLNEGSQSAVSVCGNSIPEAGEDCDFGAGNNSDAGCSNQCLNLGSLQACSTYQSRFTCLANADYCRWLPSNTDNPEAGECELRTDENNNDICELINIDSQLDTPSERRDACVGRRECRWFNNECQLSLCGNGFTEAGESCDDGNTLSGDGCSSVCLAEGSSLNYYGGVSLCGNGSIENGEQCDNGAADGRKDPRQAARALGKGQSDVTAAAGNVSCQDEQCAEVEVSCIYDSDQACVDALPVNDSNKDISKIGRGGNNCCYLRPRILQTVPFSNESNVCRNALMEFTFSELMDSAELSGNIELWKKNAEPCGQPTALNWFQKIKKFARNILVSIGVAQESNVIWCPVAGQVVDYTATISDQSGDDQEVSKVRFSLFAPLDSGQYDLLVKGDDLDTTGVEGVRSLSGGVGMREDVNTFQIHWEDGENSRDFDYQAYRLPFNVGEDICTLEQVAVDPSEHTFRRENQSKSFFATAIATGNRQIQPLPAFYDWSWSWQIADDSLLSLTENKVCDNDNSKSCSADVDCGENSKCVMASNEVTAISEPKNGQTELMAAATIETDFISDVSSQGQEFSGEAQISNKLCENFWKFSDAPDYFWSFDSAQDSAMNFGSWYCRDASRPGTTDDLPDLEPIFVSASPDALKEVFLEDPDSSDAIGFKVLTNLEHLSLLEWYRQKDFKGAPRPRVDIAGYSAMEDGNTTYIAFGNNDGTNIYTNVLVVSYNQGAGDEVKNIYKQVLDNLEFNKNLRVCGNDDNQSCSVDDNCDQGYSCQEDRDAQEKLSRDVKRWADLTDLAGYLENYYENFNEKYPQLEAGTFLRGLTVSAWPSWNAVFGKVLGKSLPIDPKNEFAGDCEEAGFDKSTCWDSADNGFYCPAGSNIYWYNARGDGQYNLAANFEYEQDIRKWSGQLPADSDIEITLAEGNRDYPLCNDLTLSGVCGDGFVDAPEEECDGDGFVSDINNNGYTCRKYYECSPDCAERQFYTDQDHTESLKINNIDNALCEQVGACGNGIIEGREQCDDGTRNGQYGYCKDDCSDRGSYCGDNAPDSPYEICDAGGQTTYNINKDDSCRWDCRDYGSYCGDGVVQSNQEECDPPGFKEAIINDDCGFDSNSNGYQQVKERKCSNNCQWEVDPDNKGCFTLGQCGNGIVEGAEQCDDDKNEQDLNNNGIDDGDEDSCTNECQLTTCGDNIIQQPNGEGINENCDRGEENGAVCSPEYGRQCVYCSSSCQPLVVSGPWCGDGIIQESKYYRTGPEDCDLSADPDGTDIFVCVGRAGAENRFWDFQKDYLNGLNDWQIVDDRFVSKIESINTGSGAQDSNKALKITASDDLRGPSHIFAIRKDFDDSLFENYNKLNFTLTANVQAADASSSGTRVAIVVGSSTPKWDDERAYADAQIDRSTPITVTFNDMPAVGVFIRLAILDTCDNCAVIFNDIKLIAKNGDDEVYVYNYDFENGFKFWYAQVPKRPLGSGERSNIKLEGQYIDAEIINVAGDWAIKLTEKQIKDSKYSLASSFGPLTSGGKYTLRAKVKAVDEDTARKVSGGIAVGDTLESVPLCDEFIKDSSGNITRCANWDNWHNIEVSNNNTFSGDDVRLFIDRDYYFCPGCQVLFDQVELYVSGDNPTCQSCGFVCSEGGRLCDNRGVDNRGVNSDGDGWVDLCDYDDDGDGSPDELDCDLNKLERLNSWGDWVLVDENNLTIGPGNEYYQGLPSIKLTKLTEVPNNRIKSYRHHYAAQFNSIALSSGQYSFSAWVKAGDEAAIGKPAGILIQRSGENYESKVQGIILTDQWQRITVDIDFGNANQTVGAYIRMYLVDGGDEDPDDGDKNDEIYSALFIPEDVGGGFDLRSPNYAEICGDGIDNNCDGEIDEGCVN